MHSQNVEGILLKDVIEILQVRLGPNHWTFAVALSNRDHFMSSSRTESELGQRHNNTKMSFMITGRLPGNVVRSTIDMLLLRDSARKLHLANKFRVRFDPFSVFSPLDHYSPSPPRRAMNDLD